MPKVLSPSSMKTIVQDLPALLGVGLGACFVLLGTGKLHHSRDNDSQSAWVARFGAPMKIIGACMIVGGLLVLTT